MEYREIPYVNKKVSRILFGSSMKPFLEGDSNDALLDAIVSLGINTIDTARVYGKAEDALGDWMERKGNRNQLVLLSKCCHFDLLTHRKRVNPHAIRKDWETSSRKLHTDFIDIYLLHRDDPDVETGPIVETLNAMHAEGKIGAFGGSNWTHQRIEEANEYAYAHNLIPFTVSSPNFGLAAQVRDPWGGGCVTISGPDNREARAWYEKNQMPVIAYSSLGHGFFSGKLKSSDTENREGVLDGPAMKGYGCPENFERLARCEILAKEKNVTVPQIAMAWIFRQKINTFAVVSTSKPERMQANIAAMELPLTPEECAWLDLETETRTI
ncbi:MAG: aldo/keto reductase [Eubacterium sp.]|nr:aldo/keto reductase [Eubacterium sp.]